MKHLLLSVLFLSASQLFYSQTTITVQCRCKDRSNNSPSTPIPPITFNYTGSVQSYIVPSGVTTMVIDGYGGKGGHGSTSWNGRGGFGGRVQATYSVTSGATIYINVGGKGGSTVNSGGTTYQPVYNPWTPGNAQGGWNGGGDPGGSSGGGGGGATDIRINGTALSNRIYVAGGGGGGEEK